MLTRIFGQITSATSIFIAIYALALCGVHFYLHQPLPNALETEYGVIIFNRILADVLYLLLIVSLIYGYQQLIFNKHKLLIHHAYLPFFITPLFLIWLPQGGLTLLLEAVIFLFILQQWLSAYQGDKMLSSSLNVGFLLGAGSLIDTEFWLLLALCSFVYTIYGRFSFRTLLIPIIGYLTIWMNLMAIEFLIKDSTVLFDGFLSHFTLQKESAFTADQYVLIFMGALAVPGIYEFSLTVSRASVFKKQSYIVLLLALVVSIISFLIYGFQPFTVAIGLPIIAILFSNYLQYITRKWITEIVLWLMLVVFGIFEAGLL